MLTSAQAIGAFAYTAGRHVVFGDGLYAPDTNNGRRLLAHELSHVVQQAAGPVDGTPLSGEVKLSNVSDHFEHQASAAAEEVVKAAPLSGLVTRLQSSAPPSGSVIQRAAKPPEVTAILLNTYKVSLPVEPNLRVKARAVSSNPEGVTFSVEKGTADVTGVTIDESLGTIAVDDNQKGGRIKVKATGADGSWAFRDLLFIEKPTNIVSTSASPINGENYGGHFIHTFTAKSGNPSALDGANINERFDSLKGESPFGSFTLAANPPGSPGWDLDASGTMGGPDRVSIEKATVDVHKFIKSASNLAPKLTLPQEFSMTQHLYAKSFPSQSYDVKPFLDVEHKRKLIGKTFVVEAGKNKVEQDYGGLPAYLNAKASPPRIPASSPKPKTQEGKRPPPWQRLKSQVTCDVIPSTAPKVFSIVGDQLECEVDANTGEVLIGDQPGTITVRITNHKGSERFDEVKITVIERKEFIEEMYRAGGATAPVVERP